VPSAQLELAKLASLEIGIEETSMTKPTLDVACWPAEGVVAREIEGEIVIVPLSSGIAETDHELYTLNDTGRAIWRDLDGRRTLKEVAAMLAEEFESPLSDIERDVLGLATELVRRGILTTRAGG
jgi:hypothetical protein